MDNKKKYSNIATYYYYIQPSSRRSPRVPTSYTRQLYDGVKCGFFGVGGLWICFILLFEQGALS